jgi:hypothetical protein
VTAVSRKGGDALRRRRISAVAKTDDFVRAYVLGAEHRMNARDRNATLARRRERWTEMLFDARDVAEHAGKAGGRDLLYGGRDPVEGTATKAIDARRPLDERLNGRTASAPGRIEDQHTVPWVSKKRTE